MTDAPRSLDPGHVDELLSADLDGELGDAARDLGYDVDDVRAQIASDPELRARRAALDRARHELGAYSPLDVVTSARLRNTARAELRAPRRTRVYAAVGAVAAAAVVIAIAAIAISSTRSTSTRVASSAAAPATITPATITPSTPGPENQSVAVGIDFGAAPNVDALAARVESTRSSGTLSTANAAAGSPSSPDAGSGGSSSQKPAGSAPNRAIACERTGQTTAGTNAQLLERGIATVDGRPVSVWVYARSGAPDVLVVVDDGCKLVAARPLGTSSR